MKLAGRAHLLRLVSQIATKPGVIAAAAILGFFLVSLYPGWTVLALRAAKTCELKFCTRMAEGEEFVIAYVHSVNRRPVYDTLRIEQEGLCIIKSRFDAFGAGTPETSTEGHPLRFGPDGWLEYSVNRKVPEVTVFVGRVAGHALQRKNMNIMLADLAEPGTAIRFSVERRSLLQIWKGRLPW
jgi:hypothetical protein